jgi:hypothetical protein
MLRGRLSRTNKMTNDPAEQVKRFETAKPHENGRPGSLGLATGSAIERHLIDDGWIMRADDEALDHDCAGWWRLDSHHSGKWMIGKPYNRNFFVPIRRAGKRPDPLADILSPNHQQ